jgi:hypothetical protein
MIHDTTQLNFSIEIESPHVAHVSQNIRKKKISDVFENFYLAKVKGVAVVIDLIPKIGKDGKNYNSVYITIDYWTNTTTAEKIRDEALLVYDLSMVLDSERK